MSANIDKRIVEMQFNNAQFEKGIQTSVQSLDALKKGLDLEKAAKGLSSLEKAGRSFSLAGISDSVSAISNRFSLMGIAGMTAIQNIVNSAFNAGKRIVSALTVDPVKTGFYEYETQINAVQTILANTSDAMNKAGYSQEKRLDIVNSKLDELNLYADKTIYNFTEMTRNIGTFTAAGVELDTAVSSIKGIANLAAVSGATSEQASRAMYQLSQAISTGTVRLMDWNSVVNAGMGGELFQKALIRTAETMGVTIDKTVTTVNEKGKKVTSVVKRTVGGLIEEAGSFRESLSDGWLTSDVLTATLSQISMDFEQIAIANGLLLESGAADIEAAKNLMRSALTAEGYGADAIEEIIALAETATDAATKVKTITQLFDTMKESAQSGWTQSWEYIIGDFEEAKELLTSISDYFGKIIGGSADSRNAMLADWKALGGRNELINSFWNIVHSIENVTGVVRSSLQKFFPPTTGKQLFDITKKITDFTEKIKAATENSELMGKVGRVFSGVGAALDVVKTAAGWAWDGLKKLFGMAEGTAGGFLDFMARIGDSLVALRDSIKGSEAIKGILSGLGAAAGAVRDLVVGAIKKIGSGISTLWNNIKASGIFTKLGDWAQTFIGRIPEFIDRIKAWGSSIIEWIKSSEMLKTAWSNIKGFFEPIIGGIAGFGKMLWEAIQSFFGADTGGEASLWERVKTRFAAFGEKIGEWFEAMKPKLTEGWNRVKAFVSTLFTKTIPDFFGSLKMKAVAKWPWLEKVFAFFGDAWARIKETCGPVIEKIKMLGTQLWESVKALFAGGEHTPKDGELTFGESIKGIVTNAWEKIKTFFGDFFTTTIPQWFEKFEGVDWGRIIKTAFGIFTGIKLVGAISGIGKLGSGLSSIGKGLKNVGGLLKDIGDDGLTITKVFKKKDSFATSLLKVAAAIGILVGSIVVLSNMEAEKAWKGIGLLTLIAGELLVITALFKKIDANGDALLKAAGAVALLVIPVYLLGKMDTGTALKGIAGVGLILTELALFMKIAGNGMEKKQSFLGLAIAVNLLVFAVKGLGNMDTGAAMKGIIGLGLIMLELSLFMNKTNTKKIGGMISMAIAMNLLVIAVRHMGSLDTGTILKGILGIGGIMAAFAILINASKGMKLGSSLLMLLTMAGSMILFIEAFKRVENMNMDSMLTFATSLSATMLALSIAMKVISMIPVVGALKGLAGFAILIVGVGAIVSALGWLQSEWGGMTDFLEGGGNVLGQIGRALGMFVGGIAGGFVEGMNLPKIGSDLSSFMTNAQGFIEGAKSIDGSTVAGVTSLAGAILAIAGTEFLTALVSLFTGENPVTKFSKDIVTLGNALTAYASAVLPMADVPQAVLDRSVSVATALAGVARQIPATGGIVGLITGVGDLGAFATNVKALGTGLADFATEISAIDDSAFNQTKIDAVVSVAAGLAKLESELEGQGGLEDAIEGVKSLSTFSEGMQPFGEGLNKFVSEIKMIEYSPETDYAMFESIISIASALAALESSLEGQGGFEDILVGVQSLSTFSEGMQPFGEGLNKFISEIKMIEYSPETDYAKFDSIISIAGALATLEKGLEGQGGFEDILVGVQSLAEFGANLPDFATGLNGFIKQISTLDDKSFDQSKIDTALAVATAINELNNSLPKTDGWAQGIMGTQDLGLFSENIKKVGEALSAFSTSVSGATINKAEDAVSALDVIRTFTSTLDAEDGLWQKIGEFFGGSKENTLLGLAENMRIFGTDLNIFSTQIEDVNVDNIGKASEVIDAIGTFIGGLVTSGSVFEIIGGFFGGNQGKTLNSMGAAMATFGENIGQLASGIENIDSTSANFEGAKKLFESFKVFYDTTAQYSDIGYSDQMYTLLWVLDEFGSSLATFQMNLGTTDVSSLATASSIIETLVNLVGSAANIDSANVAVIGSILEEYGNLSFQGFLTGFTEGSEGIASAVTGLLSQIASAIQNDTTVSSASVTLGASSVSAVRETWSSWYAAGSYLGSGIAKGIGDMAGAMRNAAINGASGAIKAIRITWAINSPSKVGEELGMYWDLGLAGGMDKYAGLVDRSSANVGESAITSAKSVLNNLSHIITSVDEEPTIRPVMDLSDISNGFNRIDGMFNTERMVGGNFFSGLSSIRNTRAMGDDQGRVTNRNDNQDVVSELQKLAKQFDELSSAVANMQVILDTGVLVGQTSAQMDTQLGTLASRRGRGG